MADYSVYPQAIDGYSQLPLVVDRVTPVDAISVNRLRSAIYNIEKELGVEPSGTYDTVRQRLDELELLINNILDGGVVSGPQGPQGFEGPQGIPGVVGAQGPQGDVGTQGPQGDIGTQGPQGDVGTQGPQGEIGDIGFPGFLYDPRRAFANQYTIGEIIYYSGQYWICIANNDAIPPTGGAIGVYWVSYSFVGAQGPQGDVGTQGPQGDVGTQGPQGDSGPSSLQAAYDGGSTITTGLNNITFNLSDGDFVVDGPSSVDFGRTGTDLFEFGVGASNINMDAAVSISFDGAQSSNFSVSGTGQTLTLESTGSGTSQVLISSNGISTSAIKIDAASLTGGINIDSGNNGIRIDSTGLISIDSTSVLGSNFTTTALNSTLTLSAAGGGTNRVIVQSAGTGDDAVTISTSAGGILVDSAGKIIFSDQYQATSSYTNDLRLSAAISEWNDFETNFGNGTSLLSAINQGFGGGGSGSSYWKDPCLVATTTNISLTGGAPSSVDGVSLAVGNRILVNNQTTASENGIYEVTTVGTGSNGTWTRTSDMNTNGIFAGSRVYIQDGSDNSRTIFTLVTTGTINFGTTGIEFIQEAPLVRTDATSTEITASTAFTNGTIIWSNPVNMRDHKEISVWFNPTSIGSNTDVYLYAQWSDDGSTIPFDDDNGIQQTDFLLTLSTDGTFRPKNYVARLTTADLELVANSIKLLSFPKKGGYFKFGVKGNSATGTFEVRSQRLA